MGIVNVDCVSKNDLFRYADMLQGTLDGYKTIESFMSNFYSIVWCMSEPGIQICNWLKATMYFDERLKLWLEK